MEKTYTYKQQGDGRDSWLCECKVDGKVVDKYMVYEDPFAPEKDIIDNLTDDQILKLKTRLGL